MNHSDFIRRIASETIQASPDELELLVRLAERLSIGRVSYGPLEIGKDPRNWRHERRLELFDAIIYTTVAELADERRRAQDDTPTLTDTRPPSVRMTGAERDG